MKRQGGTAEYAKGPKFAKIGRLFKHAFTKNISSITTRFINADDTDTTKPEKALLKWKPSVIDSQILEILYINLPSRWERCKDTIITLIESVQSSNCSVTWIRNVLTRSFLDILVRNTLAKGNHIFTCHDDCIKIYPK